MIQACAEFRASGSDVAFDQAFAGLIQHHLSRPPTKPVAELPGDTKLVEDLGLDSLTMVEMAFLFEDLFGRKLPHDEFVRVVTLDDLRTLLRRRMSDAAQT